MSDKPVPPSHSLHRIAIRLPDALHSELMERAKKNHRSLSAEGAFVLTTALAAANEKGA